jgi:hypothetical protein
LPDSKVIQSADWIAFGLQATLADQNHHFPARKDRFCLAASGGEFASQDVLLRSKVWTLRILSPALTDDVTAAIVAC